MDLLLHQVPVVPSFLLQNIILGVKYFSVGKLKGFSLTENWLSKVGGKASFDSFSLLTVAHPVIPIGVVFPLSLSPSNSLHTRACICVSFLYKRGKWKESRNTTRFSSDLQSWKLQIRIHRRIPGLSRGGFSSHRSLNSPRPGLD